MFDIGFSELVVIGVVALVVLGPERLPKVARTAGHLFGRLQRYVATVKADLNREIDMSELAKVKQEVQDAARAFEQSTQEQTRAFESEAKKVSGALQPVKETAPAAAPVAVNSQGEMLALQEQGLIDPLPATVADVNPAIAPTAAATLAPTSKNPTINVALTPLQGALDFGIEPVRTTRA